MNQLVSTSCSCYTEQCVRLLFVTVAITQIYFKTTLNIDVKMTKRLSLLHLYIYKRKDKQDKPCLHETNIHEVSEVNGR